MTTVEAVQPARTTRMVPNGGAPWVAMTVESIEEIVGDPSTWIPGLPPDRSRDLSVWSAFPLLLGGSMSRYAFWLHVVPVDVTRHVVTWYLLAHPDQVAGFAPGQAADSMETLADVHREDMATCTRVQVGLSSGLVDRLRLTPLEEPIADFQRWISARLD